MNKTHLLIFAGAALAGFFLANAPSGTGIYNVAGVGSIADQLYSTGTTI